MNGKELIKINENLKADRSLWDSQWQEIADNIVFRKASIVGKQTTGSKLTQKMYDSTATMAGEDLAAWIHGNLTSMGMEWFFLKTKGKEDNKDMQEALDECGERQFAAIRESNFAGEWLEALNDLVTFCTGGLYVEENEVTKPGFNGFNFISMPPGTYATMEGRDGRVQGIFREYELRAQEAFDRWGETVSDDVKKNVKLNPSAKHMFLHACFPKTWFGGKHKTQLEFASYNIDISKKIIMQVGGYDDFPFFIIPWRRESGESYGRGPGWTALPEVKTAHKVGELSLKEWALGIWPPVTMVENGVIGSVRQTPGGITVVRKDGDVKPWETGARYSDNRLKREDLQQTIREIFHMDKVKFLPPRDQMGQTTAYEVARRYQLSQQLLGPTHGNIVFHGLDRIVETTFNMMNRAGAFQDFAELLPVELKVEYESPLARAQKIQDIEAITNTIEAVAPIAEVKPDIMDNFKLDDTAVHVAKSLGYPAKLLNSEDERGELREARAKAEEKQQQLEQAALAAKAAKDAAGAAKDLPPEMAEMMR